ncbi:putative membrane protein [Atopobium sp. ICM42b]|uniref:fosmidomycin resistance protein n=1 Tax=Atopobium sp. ICM42b TaxID=1190620 RepID=UPI0004504F5D|nr:fosmidomycin resistance protein [Atopobium sp. ICM42b]EWC96202.1 putative membrane protein [Atopobium sp. ICM42b]
MSTTQQILPKKEVTTFAFALCHFVVDFACVSTMLCAVSRVLGESGQDSLEFVALSILLYDIVAFTLQLPVGIVLDKLDKNSYAALLSYALVGAGVLISLFPVALLEWLAVLLLAVGNALFHSAGGLIVLNISQKHAGPSGIFIATGAIGVFLGTQSAQMERLQIAFSLLVLLFLCALITLVVQKVNKKYWNVHNVAFDIPKFSSNTLLAIALLSLVVALRSYVGMVMAFPWKSQMLLLVLSILGVFAGKALGGVVADRIGFRTTAIFSLIVAATLFVPSWEVPVMGLLGVFFFNFTMSITLASLANILPNAKGTAFGLASFSLAVGALPALLGFRVEHPVMLSVISLVSALALGVGLTLVKDTVVTGPFGHERMFHTAQVAEILEEDTQTAESFDQVDELAVEDELAGEDYPVAKGKLAAEGNQAEG